MLNGIHKGKMIVQQGNKEIMERFASKGNKQKDGKTINGTKHTLAPFWKLNIF